ncbi:hypothetical protein A943_21430 [Bacillus sp. CPSM8]|nr:hypothetical protein A943_21430 [Bacillus sp. CPSM8]
MMKHQFIIGNENTKIQRCSHKQIKIFRCFEADFKLPAKRKLERL